MTTTPPQPETDIVHGSDDGPMPGLLYGVPLHSCQHIDGWPEYEHGPEWAAWSDNPTSIPKESHHETV